jgi:hypothetical protein
MSEKKSKFSGIFKTRQDGEEDVAEQSPINEPTPPTEEPRPSPALSVVQASEPAPRPKAKPRGQAPEASRPVGRPRGKRSDGDHVQVTAYIRRDTHLDVKTALLREQKGRDFSELVEELLAKWLKSRT